MITKFIGMKEFRQNMTQYSEQSRKQKIRFIVLRQNKPIMEVSPINEEDYAYLRIKKELDAAEAQIRNGDYYTHEEVLHHLGLK